MRGAIESRGKQVHLPSRFDHLVTSKLNFSSVWRYISVLIWISYLRCTWSNGLHKMDTFSTGSRKRGGLSIKCYFSRISKSVPFIANFSLKSDVTFPTQWRAVGEEDGGESARRGCSLQAGLTRRRDAAAEAVCGHRRCRRTTDVDASVEQQVVQLVGRHGQQHRHFLQF